MNPISFLDFTGEDTPGLLRNPNLKKIPTYYELNSPCAETLVCMNHLPNGKRRAGIATDFAYHRARVEGCDGDGPYDMAKTKVYISKSWRHLLFKASDSIKCRDKTLLDGDSNIYTTYDIRKSQFLFYLKRNGYIDEKLEDKEQCNLILVKFRAWLEGVHKGLRVISDRCIGDYLAQFIDGDLLDFKTINFQFASIPASVTPKACMLCITWSQVLANFSDKSIMRFVDRDGAIMPMRYSSFVKFLQDKGRFDIPIQSHDYMYAIMQQFIDSKLRQYDNECQDYIKYCADVKAEDLARHLSAIADPNKRQYVLDMLLVHSWPSSASDMNKDSEYELSLTLEASLDQSLDVMVDDFSANVKLQ